MCVLNPRIVGSQFGRELIKVGVCVAIGLACRFTAMPYAAEPIEASPAAQMGITTTNRTIIPGPNPVQYKIVTEGPLMRPTYELRKARQAGVAPKPAKAFLNLFNPFTPLSAEEATHVPTSYSFDPMNMGKVPPRAFRDDRNGEPASLVSFHLEKVKTP
jgi:hypothetical protein